MSDLLVNNEVYAYPDPGTEPGWGTDATGWAEAVTEVLASLAGPGTINEVQSNIENNISIDTSVAGLIFASSLTQSAIVMYRIQRDSDSISPLIEAGRLDIVLNNGVWEMSREITGGNPAGVSFDVDGTGQVVYQSTNIAGANYTGSVKFKTTGILT